MYVRRNVLKLNIIPNGLRVIAFIKYVWNILTAGTTGRWSVSREVGFEIHNQCANCGSGRIFLETENSVPGPWIPRTRNGFSLAPLPRGTGRGRWAVVGSDPSRAISGRRSGHVKKKKNHIARYRHDGRCAETKNFGSTTRRFVRPRDGDGARKTHVFRSRRISLTLWGEISRRPHVE